MRSVWTRNSYIRGGILMVSREIVVEYIYILQYSIPGHFPSRTQVCGPSWFSVEMIITDIRYIDRVRIITSQRSQKWASLPEADKNTRKIGVGA